MDKRLEANMRFLCDESRMLTGITVAYGTTTYSEWAQYGRAQEIDRVENGFIPAVRPLIPDTIYDLASLTKLFTAVVTLALVESGQLSLDETVGQIDPRFIHLQNVTVGDVLSFRISLQTPVSYTHLDVYKRQALIRAARQHLECAGKRFHHPGRLLTDGLEIVFIQLDRRADGMHAEHARDAADALIHIREIGYIKASLAHPHAAVHRAHGLTDVIHQFFHEERAVLPLQKDLAETNQQNFSHRFISF